MKSQGTPKTICAVDVGYGHTKFVIQRLQTGYQCGSFPSIAPVANKENNALIALGPRRNSVRVYDAKGTLREVGKDAALLADGNSVKNMDDNFTSAPEYLALFRGALHYIGQRHIDLLITGLPVNIYNIASQKKHLEDLLTGEHKTPDGEVYVVDKVVAVPQPFGGFFDYAVTNDVFGKMKNQVNLMVDPGERTFDWLVMQGMKPMPNVSHAHPRSMGAIIEAIADSLGKELGTNISSMQSMMRISESLRTGEAPIIRGKQRALDNHIPNARHIADEAMTAMAKKIGEANDIDNIIVCGGGGRYFYELIKTKYPDHNVVISNDPMFANVRGYHIAGNLWLNNASNDRVAA